MNRDDADVVSYAPVGRRWACSLLSLFLALQKNGDRRFFHPHPLNRIEVLHRLHYTGKDYYCLQLLGRDVIGYGMLRGWDEGYEIPSLGIAVHPAYRNKGSSKELMQHLHRVARERGAERIRLKVYRANIKALSLYQGLGYEFSPWGEGELVGYLSL